MKLIWACLFILSKAFDRAEIQSCSGCKLNRLADVRKFVTDESVGALSFSRVTRKFIGGHNPDLVMYTNNIEEKRIDMSTLNFDQLVQILVGNGFTKTVRNEL